MYIPEEEKRYRQQQRGTTAFIVFVVAMWAAVGLLGLLSLLDKAL